jgi:hypothetical protein
MLYRTVQDTFKSPGWYVNFNALFVENMSIVWTEEYRSMKLMVLCEEIEIMLRVLTT